MVELERSSIAALGAIMLLGGVVMVMLPARDPTSVLLGVLVLFWGFFALVYARWGGNPEAEPVQEPQTPEAPRQPELPPSGFRQVQPVAQPATKEIYRERETIIREIVKIRCRNCGTLFEEKLNCCPHCGAPP